MVLFKEGNWIMDSQYPDTNFTEEKDAFVIPDGEELANKIQSLGIVIPILDKEGNLIDVEPVPPDPEEVIQSQLKDIDFATIAPLRAILCGMATEEDQAKLAELELQASSLKASLKQVQLEKASKVDQGTIKDKGVIGDKGNLTVEGKTEV